MLDTPFKISPSPLRGACFDPATLFASAGTLGKVLSVGGTLLGVAGQIQAGNAADASARYTAAQLEASGKAENAAAQREAEEQRRQKRLVQSRARAVAGASGGGQDYDLIGDIEEDGELRALNALWEGQERAAGRNAQAAATRAEGKFKKTASYLKGGSTLISGASSFYDKYA